MGGRLRFWQPRAGPVFELFSTRFLAVRGFMWLFAGRRWRRYGRQWSAGVGIGGPRQGGVAISWPMATPEGASAISFGEWRRLFVKGGPVRLVLSWES